MKFTEKTATTQIEILKRKLGGELFEVITLTADAKAGTPIGVSGAKDTTKPVGILLNDVLVDENPNGTIVKAFANVDAKACQLNTGTEVAESVKTALPLIVFE